jgi:hypothetical protein
MTFKIEFSDVHFRLIVVSPLGEEEFLEAVLYCSVSSVCAPDGVVYGAYLTGAEPELDQLSSNEQMTEMRSQYIKVYDLTAWPNLKPVDGTVTLIDTDFTDVEDAESDGEVIDVEPIV